MAAEDASERLERDAASLWRLLRPRLKPGGEAWLEERLREIAAAATLEPAFAAAGRRVGQDPLLPAVGAARTRLHSSEGPILGPWTTDDAARVLLLLEDARREPRDATSRALDLYHHGAARERIAVLRAFQLLPDDDVGLEAVRDALRANAVDLFSAAICENLYSSRHLPDELFFQAVLKCAFVALRLDRIERVEERATPELARMLFAYVTEREHAGRPVAVDLWPLIALFPPAGTIDRIRARLDTVSAAEDRRALEVALARARRARA